MNRSDKSRKETRNQRRHREAVERYLDNPSICLNCNKIIPYERRYNKFCNQSCAASYNNRGVLRVKKTRSDTCAHCGKVKETRQNKYCNACSEARVYNKVTDLEDAQSDFVRKRILIEQRGHQCENCGLTEWLGQLVTLELHHVDGDSDNNSEENLRLLCPNCHSQTDFFKGAAKGTSARYSKRRVKRRKRYNDGKTW